MKSDAGHLPTYALYGEHGRSFGTDWLHCESIAARSQHHEWEIRPHRHETLFQILYIASGHAEMRREDEVLTLDGPCLLTVPPLAAHGFRFERDIQGTVLTVLERHLLNLLAAEKTLRERVVRPLLLRLMPADSAVDALGAAVQAVAREFHGASAWRGLAIDAALLRLLVEVGRLAPEAGDAGQRGGARALEHVRRYRELVDRRFREQPALSQFAEALGITPTQLNRVCRQVLGHPALEVLHDRLLLEAQRDLAYTTLSVKQIALGIGFADAAYFTRFFQRRTGRTPSAWRAAALR